MLAGFGLATGQNKAASDSSAPRYDLFGRPIESKAANLEGQMPAGPLIVYVDPRAPRLFSRNRSRARRTRVPSSARKLLNRSRNEQINTEAVNEATHIVKQGSSVYLRRY